MGFREVVDHRGISHLVDDKGRCQTFEGCRQHTALLPDEEKSASQLRSELRTARIQLGILERKLAAAKRQIELLKASAPLAEELAESEGSLGYGDGQ